MGGSLSPLTVTARCLLAALVQPLHPFGLWGLTGVMCQTPFPCPEQKPRREAEELRCSSPCPCWCGSLWWLISVSKCSKDAPLFSPGCCENVGQCGMGGGTRSAHMLSRGLRASEPNSEAQSRQTPAHISHNKGQIGFIMKHSPRFSD